MRCAACAGTKPMCAAFQLPVCSSRAVHLLANPSGIMMVLLVLVHVFVLRAQVKCHACVGGTSVREDARILSAGVHVVVGTPGRVYDMLRRRCLRAGETPGLPEGIGGCMWHKQ